MQYLYIEQAYQKMTLGNQDPISPQELQRNGILLQKCSDILWKKNCSSDQEKRLKFKAAGREFAKLWDY